MVTPGHEAEVTPHGGTLAKLDRWRHRVPFWWWLTYDTIVLLVIVLSVPASDPWFTVGLVVLGIAYVIDAVEFLVKRPSARVRSAVTLTPHDPDPIPSVLQRYDALAERRDLTSSRESR